MLSINRRWRGPFVAGIGCLVIMTIAVVGASLYVGLMSRGLREQRTHLIEFTSQAKTQQALLAHADARLAAASDTRVPLPASFDAGRFNVVQVQRARDGSPTSVAYWCGGADNHFGLVVTAAGVGSADLSPWPIRSQVAERIWFFDELLILPRR